MKEAGFVLILTLLSVGLFAQVNQAGNTLLPASKPEIRFIGKVRFINNATSDQEEDKTLDKDIDDGMPVDTALERVKAGKFKLKMASIKSPRNANEYRTSGTTPTNLLVSKNYRGPADRQDSPTDNTIAISKNGEIVTLINEYLGVYDTNWVNLKFVDLYHFFNSQTNMFKGTNALSTSLCDPKVIYDDQANRFIFYAQTATSQSVTNSRAIIAFSAGEYPELDWYVYSLSFDNTVAFFDYPKMAVSKNELFLTGNLYYLQGQNFYKAVIFQIDKTMGYTGSSTINYISWDNNNRNGKPNTSIQGNPSTILPVGYVPYQDADTGMYFISTSNSGSNFIKLYHITGSQYSDPEITYNAVSTEPYAVPADGMQRGTQKMLDIRDCRVQSGFYLNGIIHFVFNADAANGWSGISYHRLDVKALTDEVRTFDSAGYYDYSYPSIVSADDCSNDKSVVISFNRCGPDSYPGTGAIYCDDDMNFYSPVMINNGYSYINQGNFVNDPGDTIRRWGDYTGICRMQNSNSCSYWMAGAYGDSLLYAHYWRTEVAEFTVNPSGYNPVPVSGNDILIYPNPSADRINIVGNYNLDEIRITDVLGRLLLDLQNTNGVTKFQQIDLSRFSPGFYLVTTSSNNIIKGNKIIVAK